MGLLDATKGGRTLTGRFERGHLPRRAATGGLACGLLRASHKRKQLHRVPMENI